MFRLLVFLMIFSSAAGVSFADGPYIGFDRDKNLQCYPCIDTTPIYEEQDVGTVDSFQVFFSDMETLFDEWFCTFCIQDSAVVSELPVVRYNIPGDWQGRAIVEAPLSPYLDSHPGARCWSINGDGTLEIPIQIADPQAVATVTYTVNESGCANWAFDLDGNASYWWDLASEDHLFEETCRQSTCQPGDLHSHANLFGQPHSSSEVDIWWSDRSHGEVATELQRYNRAVDSFETVAWVFDTTTHRDHSLNAGTRYQYRMRPFDCTGATNWDSADTLVVRTKPDPVQRANDFKTSSRRYLDFAVPEGLGKIQWESILGSLGSPDSTSWRFGHWSEVNGRFEEAGDDLDSVQAGLGYWLITSEPRTITWSGRYEPEGDCPLVLRGDKHAWTQFGNPFLDTIDVNAIRISDPTGTTFFEFGDTSYADSRIYGWDPGIGEFGGFVVAEHLLPWHAYWVRKTSEDDDGVLWIPWSVQSAKVSPKSNALGREEPPTTWEIHLTARQNGEATAPLEVGAAPEGNAEHTARVLPPYPPGDFVQLRIADRDVDKSGGRLVRSIVTEAGTLAWTMILEGGLVPGQIDLTTEFLQVPEATTVLLEDVESGRSWDLHEFPSLGFAVRAQPRQLRLVVSTSETEDSGDEEHGSPLFVGVYPNPSSGDAGLLFHSYDGTPVSISIYHPNGRLVRSLQTTRDVPGELVATWDGRNERGEVVAPGVYLARYRSGSREGTARLVRVR